MLISTIILIFFVSRSLFALELNIHRSVTEVRQSQSGVGSYQYYFKNNEYANIIDGSISWDGTPFVKQEVYSNTDMLKDALVVVQSSSDCKCKPIQAKVVDPTTMLLRNLATNGYFYAGSHFIEYSTVRPDNGGTTLQLEFKTKGTKFNGTLSYLVQGITWAPNYDFFFEDTNKCDLRAYANIQNNQQQEYQVNSTNLYSGNIQLVTTQSFMVPQATVFRAAALAMTDASSIQALGEQKGVYFYSLTDSYTLRPKTSVRVPFIRVNTGCKFYYQTSTSVTNGENKGVFQRYYDITPDQFLPAGTITIRDNQILIGQSSLPDVPVNYTQTVTQGDDTDVQYVIVGTVVESNKTATQLISQTYELDITISNYKSKSVAGQLKLYGAVQTTIVKTTCNSITITANVINVPFQVTQNFNYQCRTTVILQWA